MVNAPFTVAETNHFSARADKLLSEIHRQEIAVMVAENPACGPVMAGTGGCRKVRFAFRGRGKSGGVRVIYLNCGETAPIFLLALFAKNERANLSKQERNELAKVAEFICRCYGD